MGYCHLDFPVHHLRIRLRVSFDRPVGRERKHHPIRWYRQRPSYRPKTRRLLSCHRMRSRDYNCYYCPAHQLKIRLREWSGRSVGREQKYLSFCRYRLRLSYWHQKRRRQLDHRMRLKEFGCYRSPAHQLKIYLRGLSVRSADRERIHLSDYWYRHRLNC